MQENQRQFIKIAKDTHPILQEIPIEFHKIWFKSYISEDTDNQLYLSMERVYKDPHLKNSSSADLLTFEIVGMEELLEWEEEYPNQEFIAINPSYIFWDELITANESIFSIGALDYKNMKFIPELEITIKIQNNNLIIDFQDDAKANLWNLVNR